ncbi:Eco57I restriction-modification methylase domain-containing protein [Colwellia sp. MB3u-55]|uniref:Eco57I restriction-modification methylase domain-containing protein n=1 Tax=Colwellia sp. MB3u-55 TaxID=2759810 RepID=UPI0015F39992|nr:DNA methyltransferase [Colwellia sp. MB3u-55]MBA6252812.1 hypothetical protein [Colwellia sp. MB3u-55]
MTYSTNQHAEWLSLIEVSGPFLAEPILNQAFPQGLEKVDPVKKKQFRQTYDEWREVTDSDAQQDIQIKDKIHQQWINWVLKVGLELDEDDDGDTLKDQSQMHASIHVIVPEHHVTIKPEYVVIGDDETQPYMLVQTYPAGTALSEVLRGDGWSTSPAERMAHLCRGVGTRLGLITNGEQWMFIDAPAGGTTTYASWFARLWGLESVTLKAFYSLFNIKIVYSGFDDNKTLPQLVDESLTHQGDVTQALGSQVSRAVEVLIQSIDRLNHDDKGELLKEIEPEELYEAGLTLMMRLVFLLCAEERGLLLLGDQAYEANYALSTLRAKLREEASLHGDEVLSYRKNAWARLLAIFRSVYAGVEHENMRMPALGGSLFDPDRFPFLEGRAKDSNWREDEAKPLPIDNRTVLLFLDAIQLYKGRTLSYRALDVEQIGYVYEGLLEQTVKRATDVTLELKATKSCKKPWVYLGELASSSLDGDAVLKTLLKERTGSSASRIINDLAKEVTDGDIDKLMEACHNDAELCQRIKPYYHFIRTDAWDNPLVYPKYSYMLTSGSDRRETGSHYTPKSLTESIVTETLEPVVYIGPSEGKPREEWQLKSPKELLELKICDPAMGSGAFLVQVCRWLAERVCESWLIVEQSGSFVTAQGITTTDDSQELIPIDAEERLIIAKRLISERCLYGVDINPLAVELAKLSIWLVTLSKDRPFGFLDHNLKSGDSLLGIHNLDQLSYLNLNPSQIKKSKLVEQPFAKQIKMHVADALELRKQIRSHDIHTVTDIDEMAHLETKTRDKLLLPTLIADALIGITLESSGKLTDITVLSSYAQEATEGKEESLEMLRKIAYRGLSSDLPVNKKTRVAFHWVLQFPEVFCGEKVGFDAIIGNPPFLGNTSIRGTNGKSYRDFLTNVTANGRKGKADLVVFFFLRSFLLIRDLKFMGLIATSSISEGESKEVGLRHILNNEGSIYSATPMLKWVGSASIIVSVVHLKKGKWEGKITLSELNVSFISDNLTSGQRWVPVSLKANKGLVFKGTEPNGEGFLIEENLAKAIIQSNEANSNVLFPYLIAREVNQNSSQSSNRWIINFWDWNEIKSRAYDSIFSIVEREMKHIRQKKNIKGEYVLGKSLAENWWLLKRTRPELYHKIGRGADFDYQPSNWKDDLPIEKVIVFARGATKFLSFSYVNNNQIFGDSLCVITSDSYSLLAMLSSDFHTVWAWEFGGRKTHDLRYIQDDVFDTFPLPIGLMSGSYQLMENLGEDFVCLRLAYMQQHNIGMTKYYNDLHDSAINTMEIKALREKQIALNNSVLAAYGFDDLKPEYDFHQVGYLPEGKNTRFTISETAREEVLYRLAMLNKTRHEAEQE